MGRQQRYKALWQAVKEIEPRNIMEIGVWRAHHAEELIQRAGRYNPLGKIFYWGFDTFTPPTKEQIEVETAKSLPPLTLDQAYEKLISTNANISLIPGNTRESLPRWLERLPPMDLIFIDGGHSLETIESDWRCCQKLMHEKTICLLDDYYPDDYSKGCAVLSHKLESSLSFDVEFLPVIDYEPDANLRIQMVKVQRKPQQKAA